jgi:hypothetical protein
MIAPTQSRQTPEVPEYFICQYMPDAFRKEPRNVGVIVHWHDSVTAQFIGETANDIDGRGLKWIHDLGVYKEWVRFWKRTIKENLPNLGDRLFETSRTNYFVVSGGAVDQVGNDDITQVCEFLYSTIVSRNGIDDLVEEEVTETPRIRLRRNVSTWFRKAGIFGTQSQVVAPVLEDQDIFGSAKPHTFAYAQKSRDTIRPIEIFDMESGQKDQIRYHAGWARFAFDDVRNSHSSINVDAISIVIPAVSPSKIEVGEYCLDVLRDSSRVIDWSKGPEKDRLLEDCKKTSGLLL